MNYVLTQNSSKDPSNLVKNTSVYDVKIRVGKKPNIKEFKAHSFILSSKSNYFKKAFSEQWARKEGGFFISNQPNISPTVFEALINLIYSETISIGSNESLVDVLIVSDELELLEIYQQLEKHLLENESAWKFPKDFITLCQHGLLTDLYQFAIKLVCRNPKLIVDSKEFINLEEQHLIQILKCDELMLEEIEIWEYLIEWGIENTDSISNDDFTEWTSMDFNWRSDHEYQASDSFLFSLFSLTNGVIPILSRISSKNEAIIWCKNKGPCFGFQDLWIRSDSRFGKSKQKSYEKKIIDNESFNIAEYEVFQVIDKRFSFFKLIKEIYDFIETVEKRFRENVEKKFRGIVRKIIHSDLALLVFIIFKFFKFGVTLFNYVLLIILLGGVLVKDIIKYILNLRVIVVLNR
ncbi:unnamed protein product [Rhizophagus irregularis]|nr:unnamed protein product [Rhizophagus irregularis]